MLRWAVRSDVPDLLLNYRNIKILEKIAKLALSCLGSNPCIDFIHSEESFDYVTEIRKCNPHVKTNEEPRQRVMQAYKWKFAYAVGYANKIELRTNVDPIIRATAQKRIEADFAKFLPLSKFTLHSKIAKHLMLPWLN